MFCTVGASANRLTGGAPPFPPPVRRRASVPVRRVRALLRVGERAEGALEDALGQEGLPLPHVQRGVHDQRVPHAPHGAAQRLATLQVPLLQRHVLNGGTLQEAHEGAPERGQRRRRR